MPSARINKKVTVFEAVRIIKEFIRGDLTRKNWFKKIKLHIKAILLYGSVAKGTNRPDSDIDILIITPLKIGSLLRAGVSSLIALEITQEAVPNTQFREVIAEARNSVEKGKPLSQAFIDASTIYPPMFSEMAAVGEETGDVPSMLARVADFYEEEVEEETKDISTIIEPILMVVIGGGVGFFAIAMIAPIYSISGSI